MLFGNDLKTTLPLFMEFWGEEAVGNCDVRSSAVKLGLKLLFFTQICKHLRKYYLIA